MGEGDLGDHKLQLSKEVLDAVELDDSSTESLLLKAIRLARLTDNDDALTWLNWELHGYPGGSDAAFAAMKTMGRVTDEGEKKGFWFGLGELESLVTTYETRLAGLRMPDVSGEYASIALREIRQEQAAVASVMSRLKTVRARFRAKLHGFATATYYELAFGDRQQQLFEAARAEIDALLRPLSGEVLSKVDSIYRRLSEDDPEAVSQALNTCRRLIDAVADEIYPASDGTVELSGSEVKVGAGQHQNRLNAYMHFRTESRSRRARLRRTLADLYERVSVGVHSDVEPAEARYLFLSTYTFLGEVLALGANPEATKPDAADAS